MCHFFFFFSFLANNNSNNKHNNNMYLSRSDDYRKIGSSVTWMTSNHSLIHIFIFSFILRREFCFIVRVCGCGSLFCLLSPCQALWIKESIVDENNIQNNEKQFYKSNYKKRYKIHKLSSHNRFALLRPKWMTTLSCIPYIQLSLLCTMNVQTGTHILKAWCVTLTGI